MWALFTTPLLAQMPGATDKTLADKPQTSVSPIAGEFLVAHIGLAKSLDPNYLAAIAAMEAAEKALDGAEAQLGPKVTLSMSIFKTERLEEVTSFSGQRSDIDRRFESRLNQLQARQPLYRKREFLGVEQAVAQVESARRTLKAAEQDLNLRVVLAWVEILTARANSAAFETSLRAAQDSLTEMGRRYKAGDATIQEVDQEQARVIQAQALIADAAAQQEIADQALRNIVGQSASVPRQLSLISFAPPTGRIDSQAELIELVDGQNQEIAAARFQEEASRLEREKARADHFPTLDAIATASQGRNDTLPSIKNEQRLGVQLSVPIYTYGAITAAVAQADANYRRAQAQTQSTILRVRTDALTAAGNLRAMNLRVEAADRLYQANLLSLKAQRIGLKAGVASRAEVARTMTDVLNSARQRVAVRKDQAIAWVRYVASISHFNEQLLETLQRGLYSKSKDFEDY